MKKYKCPNITHVILIVRIPFTDVIIPLGTVVENIARVFFTNEKLIRIFVIMLPEKKIICEHFKMLCELEYITKI